MNTPFLCEYVLITFTQPDSFWDRIIGTKYTSSNLILIMAESEEEAERKFLEFYKIRHPGRILKAYTLGKTIL